MKKREWSNEKRIKRRRKSMIIRSRKELRNMSRKSNRETMKEKEDRL